MTIEEMHLDFDMKLNKVDSAQNKNFRVPEKDWLLNGAQELFVKMVAHPRLRKHLGFETSQRSIDDVRTLVREREDLEIKDNVVQLPFRYLHFLSAKAEGKLSCCEPDTVSVVVRQHDDEFELSPFDRSSFEWRELNVVFQEEGIQLYPGDMEITKFELTYLLTPHYMHYAQGARGGSYKSPSGALLSGKVDCQLPAHTHREIVDLSVMLALGQISPDINFSTLKLNLNGLM